MPILLVKRDNVNSLILLNLDVWDGWEGGEILKNKVLGSALYILIFCAH